MSLDTASVLHLTELLGKADFKILPLNLTSLIFFLDSHWQLHVYPDLRTELLHGPVLAHQAVTLPASGSPPSLAGTTWSPAVTPEDQRFNTGALSANDTWMLKVPLGTSESIYSFSLKSENVSKWALRDLLWWGYIYF